MNLASTNNNSNNFYNTLNNSSFSTAKSSNKHKNILRSKLSYEWKNIYRQLSMNDKLSNGTVSI